MNSFIHPTAIISAGASIGENVVIHPYVVIGDGVTIADNVEIYPGAYLGKEPKGAGTLARQPVFERKLFIGANCSIGPHTTLYYDVEIGNNTLIGDGASIREQVIIGSYCIIGRQVTINYNTKIGNKTKIMDLSHITGNAWLGERVFVSVGVYTANDNNMSCREYSEGSIQGPRIEDGANIGLGAKLLPGVVIGRDAQVGAGAVVTKNVPPMTTVMGVPAKIIRSAGEVTI